MGHPWLRLCICSRSGAVGVVVVVNVVVVDCEARAEVPASSTEDAAVRVLASPTYGQRESHFRRPERSAHAVFRQATIIASVAPTPTFIRTTDPDTLTSPLRGTIAPAATALLRLPHSTQQRDHEPATSHCNHWLPAGFLPRLLLSKETRLGVSPARNNALQYRHDAFTNRRSH